jgi:hypothetical protein
MKKTKTKTETLGEAPAVIRVKQVRGLWLCGCTITSDTDGVDIKLPCGRGGVVECTRERAVLLLIHSVRRHMESRGYKALTFEKAKEVLRKIEDSIQPKLF